MALLALFAALLFGPCLSSSYAEEPSPDPSQIIARLMTLSATLRARLTEQEASLATSQDERERLHRELEKARTEAASIRVLWIEQGKRSTELGQALQELSSGIEIAKQSLTRLNAYWESYQTNMARTMAQERAARLEAERAAVVWKYVGIAGLAGGAAGVVWGLTR